MTDYHRFVRSIIEELPDKHVVAYYLNEDTDNIFIFKHEDGTYLVTIDCQEGQWIYAAPDEFDSFEEAKELFLCYVEENQEIAKLNNREVIQPVFRSN